MVTIVVSGALANKPRNGGGAWERLSWVAGFRRLGFDVYFIEQIAPENCVDVHGRRVPFTDSENAAWFRSITEWFQLADQSALVGASGQQSVGMSWQQVTEKLKASELLVNLSGHLTLPALLDCVRRKAYVDVDPGFTQFWHADPSLPFEVAPHDEYFTIGENIGQSTCAIPTNGIAWRPTRQPVVLDSWPVVRQHNPSPFTTIASWRGAYGPLTVNGMRYGIKAHEFRKILELPKTVNHDFEIALDIHPGELNDLQMLCANGWRLVDPLASAGTAERFREYVQQSGAEFSVAQGMYVDTNCGWFSDRTTRYLASGKPVLVQDTGFGRNLSTGSGLLSFRNLDEAVAGVEEIRSNYKFHCHAARQTAEDHFDSDKVLRRFLQNVH